MEPSPPNADRFESHFESLEQQADAARLGMWVFLASEILLFAALFALYASYRAEHPIAFHEAMHHNSKILGSLNTAVLLTSSALVAGAVHALRLARPRVAMGLVVGTMALGATFLLIKSFEYRAHFAEGIFPGGHGAFFAENPQYKAEGLPIFFSLYYGMTGIHGIHVVVGLIVLGFMVAGIRAGTITPELEHRLEIGAIYWHLVDVVWIFLWPLFYLA